MSSSHLCPCPACNRHVMTDAGICPFCQAALPATPCATTAPAAAAPARMSRAARLLAGATLVGVSACSSTQPEPGPVPYYGAPIPVDARGAGGAGSAARATRARAARARAARARAARVVPPMPAARSPSTARRRPPTATAAAAERSDFVGPDVSRIFPGVKKE